MAVAVAMAVGVLGWSAAPASAANLTIPTGGTVSVEFAFKHADFINRMSVTAPVSRALFNTDTSRIGTRTELGTFAANTTFVFRLDAAAPAVGFTWSSDPAANGDGQDHMRVTELRDGDATLDDRVYKLEWEDDEDLGDRDFNDAVAILRVGGDTDQDGLYDDWERFGIDANSDGDTTDAGEQELPNGIDQNGNGTTTDPGERADPRHKDLFIEMDWMACATGGDCAATDTHTHRPQAAAITNVIQAFANHPSVTNPDGRPGINVHIDVSNAIAHQNVLNFNGGALGCSSNVASTGSGDFDTVKTANFANADVRRFAFHYALAIHVENQAALTDANSRFSGCGELPGNDFYISFGLWPAGRPTVQDEAGTIMHELGHNLGLQHGGNEAVNYKPNYLSVMNYSFQLGGIPLTGRLDYSRQALPALTEADPPGLNENLGIQDGTDGTLFYCPGTTSATGNPTTPGAGTGAINWDCNSPATFTTVGADINGDTVRTTLNGFNDWPEAVRNLPFQTTGDFQDGSHLDLPEEELDQQVALDFALVFSSGRTGNGDIYAVDDAGAALRQVTSGAAIDAEPAWSPDHRRIAFTSTRDGNVEIYVMNADGTGVTRLTRSPAIDASPAWSPDGTRIAFVSTRASRTGDIFVMGAADGTPVTRLTAHPAIDASPDWSPDGERIAFSSTRTGAGDIYAMRATGGAETQLTSSPRIDAEPTWAGSTIAFSTNRDGLANFEIYTMNEDGTAQIRRTNDPARDVTPAWSADAGRLAFATDRHGLLNFEIYTMNADGSGAGRLTTERAIDAFPDW